MSTTDTQAQHQAKATAGTCSSPADHAVDPAIEHDAASQPQASAPERTTPENPGPEHPHGSTGQPARHPLTAIGRLRAYIALTKPRIIELLLVTTVPTMIVAQAWQVRHEGQPLTTWSALPSLSLVLLTLLGGTLAAGGANTLNCYFDRDIDKLMQRTAHRPLAHGDIAPRNALIFGLVLSLTSVVLMAWWVNAAAASLSAAAIAMYVLGYTLLLKRRTSQNIVWGGAAGCMPVLIAWAAVTGTMHPAAWALFAVVFFWTPPHYWPLALRFRQDYASANVPMLPVVAQEPVVARRIVVYSWLMVGASLAVWPLAQMGAVYAVCAVAVGAWFLIEAHRLQRQVGKGVRGAQLKPMRLFHGSISYLSLLFLALALDPLVHIDLWPVR